MKTIIVLLLICCSLTSFAQDAKSSAPEKKRLVIDKVEVKPIKIIAVVDNQAHGTQLKNDNPSTYTFTRKQLEEMPTIDLRDIAGTIPGVYQSRRGDNLSFFGARASSTGYIIDGVQLMQK